MTPSRLTLGGLAEGSVVPPSDFRTAPGRVSEIADIALELPDMAATLSAAASWGFYDRDRIQEALVGLSIGHVLLAGPPGTGKTKLAGHLASAFGATLLRETANAEWSVYDVIGTLSLGDKGETAPRHGLVTNAVLECAATTVRNLDTGQGPQATWLLIDEINRAEIDRAFGSLFTALSGDDKGSYTLDYITGYPVLTLPRRFRIICTMNDYDTRFVNSMSSGLRRRFARVLIVPPENVGDMIPEAEMEAALRGAYEIALFRLGTERADAANALVKERRDLFRQVFGAIRKVDTSIGIPIGTAQVMDSCLYAIAFVALVGTPTNDDEWWRVIDRIVATRLVSSLESDSTRLRISDTYVSTVAQKLPKLPDTCKRLHEFLHGAG